MSVDVLAVMSAAAKRLRLGVEGPLVADEVEQSRAAIAELIAAAMDAAKRRDELRANLREQDGDAFNALLLSLNAAEDRLAAALAAVGGEVQG